MAPGMHFDTPMPTTPASTQNPVIRPITPQLVQEERRLREQQSVANIDALMATSRPYTIDSGDVLSIVVWGHPELTNAQAAGYTSDTLQVAPPTAAPAGFVVDHQGNVQFPYAGMLKLSGMTEDQARRELSHKLAYYITKPDVTLRVQSYRSKRIYIDGEVRTPGMVSINDIPMTLVEALNRAGGTSASADQSRIVIVRDGMSYPVNLLQLVRRGVNPASIMLANGDVVRVLSRDESKVFVSGEVMAPKALTMHDGRLTLNEALGEAGGINPNSGDGRQVYVIRNGGDAQPLVFHLNARSPTELALAEEFELRPKDVVYVDATGLATWSRVVNLVLPSAFSGAVSSAATFRAIR
ncbi:MAG: polysaccharide biosynthesis/export family protein [Herminiimonas sp.]|nr:polysaccharide biosynthesis/export family protein [Herminiimonas sp.]